MGSDPTDVPEKLDAGQPERRQYPAMQMRIVRLTDTAVVPLLAGLTHEYDTRYGANIEMTRTKEDEFDPPAGLFIVVMDGPKALYVGRGYSRTDFYGHYPDARAFSINLRPT
jgi:hypothetical protein